ncbi:MAG TPA: acylphosphatase [Cytophagales bacterium]|jgi:acylphosphatase|nr:acylphosphatase [Cytophagales bacterium]
MVHRIIKIKGRVQGVGFRAFVTDQARKLGINGFVRNEPDRSVYIEASGPEHEMQVFIDKCKKGPMMGNVERLEQTANMNEYTDGFFVRY